MPSERALQVATDILAAFESGNIPSACATIFLRRSDDIPSARWSWGNRLIVALHGHVDARGFRQWKAVGRSVRRGERALYIFAPILVREKRDETTTSEDAEAPSRRVVGFREVPVFGYDQTEGEPLAGEAEHGVFLDSLPLIEVARTWGLEVGTFRPADRRQHASYDSSRQTISLAVENLATWTHELVHHAASRIMPTGA
jgi:hypothetical protein